jgi:hypothetical protein
LADRVPLVVFLMKMAAVVSEKTIRSSLPGMMLWLCKATLPPWRPGGRGGAQGCDPLPGCADALAVLLGRPGGGCRESGGRPACGGRKPCPAGAPF